MSQSVLGALEQAAVTEIVEAIVRDKRALDEIAKHMSPQPATLKLILDEDALAALRTPRPRRPDAPTPARRPMGDVILGLAVLLYLAAALALVAADKAVPVAMSVVAAIAAGGLCLSVLVRTFKS